MEGNLRFKIDSASLIVGRKFTVFALFYFVCEGNFQVQTPRGLIHGGAYFRNIAVCNVEAIRAMFCKLHNVSWGFSADYEHSPVQKIRQICRFRVQVYKVKLQNPCHLIITQSKSERVS